MREAAVVYQFASPGTKDRESTNDDRKRKGDRSML
jgi:hypothetical protein